MNLHRTIFHPHSLSNDALTYAKASYQSPRLQCLDWTDILRVLGRMTHLGLKPHNNRGSQGISGISQHLQS